MCLTKSSRKYSTYCSTVLCVSVNSYSKVREKRCCRSFFFSVPCFDVPGVGTWVEICSQGSLRCCGVTRCELSSSLRRSQDDRSAVITTCTQSRSVSLVTRYTNAARRHFGRSSPVPTPTEGLITSHSVCSSARRVVRLPPSTCHQSFC